MGSRRKLFNMEEITACFSTDGDDLVEKENGNKKIKEDFWSCVVEFVRIRSNAQADGLALGAQAVPPEKSREGRVNT